jgi:hypothetical protein
VNDGSSWSFFYNLPIPNIKFETELNHLILFSDWGVSVEDYSLNTIANVNGNSYNNGAPISGYVDSDGLFWIADGRNGLVRCSNNNYDFIYPNGPYNIATWSMAVSKDNLWVTGGAINLQAPTWSTYGTYLYNDYSNWKNFNRLTDPGYDTLGFPDEVCVAIDPQDTKHAFVGTWGSGLLEYRENGIVSVFNSSNSTLQPIYNPTFHPVYVGGIAFDKNNSLWIANPMNPTPISVRYADGSWKSFQISGNFANVATFGLIVDSYNQKWIIARGSGGDALGLGVFNENDPSNSSDDTFKLVNSTSGQGGLVSLNIYSIAEDKDGAIWIGSDQGVSVIYNPGNVFTGGNYDAQQILIEQEGQAQYLLATDYVMAIAVDGANRKWFGTLSGGVFLMSADGTKQLLNFNMDNSPLLSNRIYSIAIDPNTGEVYFGTDAGICSYRGDATEGGETCEDYYVFPNPVAHNYHGPIAIKGLVSNAFVKITDLSGQVVYQTKANGGLATWNGNNFQGVRAKTGVYLVYITNDDGSSTCVTKMVFTN